MAGRKDPKSKDGKVVKGEADGKLYCCFKVDAEFVGRLDAIAQTIGPVPINRSETIRLFLETMIGPVEACGFEAVQAVLKKCTKPVRRRR